MVTISFSKEPPLLVFPTLAKEIGLNEAIILHQVHYWLNPKINKNIFYKKLWVRNTYQQWQRQFPFWSLLTIRRTIIKLEEQELLLSFIRCDIQRAKYYTINYEKLHKLTLVEDQSSCNLRTFPNESIGFQASDQIDRTSNQNDHTSGQIDHTPLIKMITTYIDTETTYTETTHNILLPPLTSPLMNFEKKEEEEEILKKMINFWNEIIQSKLYPAYPQVQLTQLRRERLHKLMQTLLADDLTQWQAYCFKISQCSYLMGGSPSGFKVSLDWALKPENALKVLEGAIYGKPQEKKPKVLTWPEYVACLEEHCDQHHYSDDWFEVCKELAQRLGQSTFDSWLKQLIPLDVTNEIILLGAASRFSCDFIETNFRFALMDTLQAVYPHATAFRIQVKGKSR